MYQIDSLHGAQQFQNHKRRKFFTVHSVGKNKFTNTNILKTEIMSFNGKSFNTNI